jgi:hypothetical protein
MNLSAMKHVRHAPLAALLASVLAAGCASAPPAAPPRDPNLVAVTFYRPHSDLHPGDYPYVYTDKDRKGTLADNTSVAFDLQAGSHRMSLNNPALWDSEQFWTFNAVAGRKYFFRLRVGESEGSEGSLPRYVSRFARVDEVPEAAAKAEIAAMNPPPAH